MVEKMPAEYRGKLLSQTDYTLTAPREWNDKELEWLKLMLDKGYSAKEIAYSMERSLTSVKIKIKRISKKENTYNAKHVLEKYSINEAFLEEIKPATVLDLYTGEKNFYKAYNVTTNDINEAIPADYHKDAFKLICELYVKDCSYDLIDLDPYGSSYDCFNLAIKMAKKGLCITLGELGHKRWKRLDFVSRYYGIDKLEDFTIDNLIKHIQRIGLQNKKSLIVYELREWQNIGRVWFKIEPIKILDSQVKQDAEPTTIFDFLEG